AVALHAHHLVRGTRRLVALEAVAAAPAGVVVVDVALPAGGNVADAVPHRHDLTGDVVAGNHGQAGGVGVADVLAHPVVEPVHRHGGHPHHHLAVARRRIRPRLQGEHLGPSMPRHDDC